MHLQHPSQSTSGDGKLAMSIQYCTRLHPIIIPFPEPPDLGDLIKILYPVASKWEILGLMLRVTYSELEKIQKENEKNVSKCLLEMLNWWLRNIPNCSWSSVAEALEIIEEKMLAKKVIETHCRSTSRLNTRN